MESTLADNASKDSIYKSTDTAINTTDAALGELDNVPEVALQKPFNLLSCLGLQYSLTSTPLAIGTYLAVSIGVGGSPVFVYGYILAVVLNLCVCASLCEIAAVYPHTAGKFIWVPRLELKLIITRTNLLDSCSCAKTSCSCSQLYHSLVSSRCLVFPRSSMLFTRVTADLGFGSSV